MSGSQCQPHSRVRSLSSPGEADPVVDPVDVTADHGQQVAALAVGVVDHRVEHGDPPQPRVRGAHQALEVHRRVHVDPALHGAAPERPVAQGGLRHDVPAGRLADEPGGVLPLGEGAVGEVPQRTLPLHRLVDAGAGHPVEGDRAEQRGVARVDDPALDLEGAPAEQLGPAGAVEVRGRLRRHRDGTGCGLVVGRVPVLREVLPRLVVGVGEGAQHVAEDVDELGVGLRALPAHLSAGGRSAAGRRDRLARAAGSTAGRAGDRRRRRARPGR